ncbi:thiosulfate oxidation carrier protein SoxY [Chthonobacter albigriseus]|uniref:thiosulfate oxidation carrier protein SoxY n=1 Tax=Chthonobacter albigriseus TaxID=1683161 RepID=UPI001FCE51AD|nr:thiosulfate oxidation carrier protein SoxY [Chthonobacter albigriseus]
MICTRRLFLAAATCNVIVTPLAAWASSGRFDAERELFTGGTPEISGGISLTIPPVAESGYTVPVRVLALESDTVIRQMRVFAPANPLVRVATFELGPMAQPLDLAFRIRLARSQTVTVLARTQDGRVLRADAPVDVVTGGCGFDLQVQP